jgi:hypothetical protein
VLVQDRGGIVRTRLIPSIGIILAALAASSGIVGVTLSAFSAPTSNDGSSFATASSFGGSCGTAPTPVWINGMEHGSTQTPDIFSQTLGVANYDATVAHTGTGSLKVSKSSSISYIRKAISGNTQVLHFALRIASLPTGDVTLASLDSTIGTDLLIRYQAATQKLALQWGTGTAVAASSTVTTATWYTIDIKTSTAVSPLTASWQIDGVDQPDASSTAAATGQGNLHFGTSASESPTYVINFDDIFYSRTLADYPLGDIRIRALHPDSGGTHNNAGAFRNNGDTAIDADSWMRIDDPSIFGGNADYVKQVAADTSGYLEFGFENTSETCIRGVQAYASLGSLSSQGNTLKSSVFDGSTERVVYSGGSPCGACTQPKNVLVAPAASAWTQAAVNGLVMRNGYASANTPQAFWSALMLEYAAK